MQNIIKKADILVEAIPYINQFRKKLFVVKYGGSMLENESIRKGVLEDLVFLSYVGIRTILVHGGGPYISGRLKEKGIKPVFHEGIRVTNKETLEIVIDELTKLNKKIINEIEDLKGDVSGLEGHENIIHVTKKKSSEDLGYVGTIKNVERDVLNDYLKKGYITVVSPLGICAKNQPHNINADEVASAIASSMNAEKLVLLTNVPGILREQNDLESLISTLKIDEIENLKKMTVIDGGMIPKVDACVEALNGGVVKTHILDARINI